MNHKTVEDQLFALHALYEHKEGRGGDLTDLRQGALAAAGRKMLHEAAGSVQAAAEVRVVALQLASWSQT